MAIDFPAGAANGATHTAAGVVWLYDGVKWKANSATIPGDITSVTAGTGLSGGGTVGDLTLALATPVSVANGGTGSSTAAAAPFVEIAGDTVTGDLYLNANTVARGTVYVAPTGGTDAQIILNKPNAGLNATIRGQTAGVTRWLLALGDYTAESGGGTGSDFTVFRYNDAGTLLDTPLKISRGAATTTLHSLNVINGINSAGSITINNGAVVDAVLQLQNASRIWRMLTNAGGPFQIFDASAVATRIQINTDGSCWSTNGTWNSLSDISVKHADSIRPYTRGLADLIRLEPVMYKYNGKGGTADDDIQQYGLIAQQVQPIVPEIVNTTVSDGEELLGVDSGRLTYAMLNALREIDQRLRGLEDR